MATLRILLLSNTRPSRAWRFIRRIQADAPAARVCALAQCQLTELDAVQQTLAAGEETAPAKAGASIRMRFLLRRLWGRLAKRALWCVHGFPGGISSPPIRREQELAARCNSLGITCVTARELTGPLVGDFIRRSPADVVVVLGAAPASTNDLAPNQRILWAAIDETNRNVVAIRIKYGSNRGESQTVASIDIPIQARDGELGLVLKAELLTGDLLIQSIAHLQSGHADTLQGALANWTASVLTPYLSQIEAQPRDALSASPRRWSRSAWSLCFNTFLLCSPLVLVRNWVRASRGKYPVLILAHHLVSDRGHRMGMSTEAFWRQVRFLRRHYRIVSLSEATELLKSGIVDRPTVVLTFDDGYADNFVSLRAVAEEMEIPVSLFVTTQPVQLRAEFHHDLVKGDRGAFAMTWDQIRFWQSHGGEFGSHTRTHVKCGAVDNSVLREELIGSRDDFEHQLGGPPKFFAFPYGDRDNMPTGAVKIAAATYPYYLSAYGGENFPSSQHKLNHLFRKKAYPEPWELELELQSLFEYVERLKNLFRAGSEHKVSREVTPAGTKRFAAPEPSGSQLAGTASSTGVSQLKPQ
jgi:peptidoglycan/xylan/chitin deacetylase (PgdA/CDA1 family)